jgi:high affinity Mn2+ porin
LVGSDKQFIITPKDYQQAHGETFEFILPFKKDYSDFLKLTLFANHSPAAAYADAINVLQKNRADTTIIPINYENMYAPSSHLVSIALDSMRGKSKIYYGKVGFVLSYEKTWNLHTFFVRLSWNDGQRETWMYTEIDRSLAFGTFLNGHKWKRPNDRCRIGFAINGISDKHQQYLLNGGYGFIIGDGFNQLTQTTNYVKGIKPEMIVEFQYDYNFTKQLIFSPDYQFIANPGYNAARGPVHIFGLRAHFSI